MTPSLASSFLKSVRFLEYAILTPLSEPLCKWHLTVNLSHSNSPPNTSKNEPSVPPRHSLNEDGYVRENLDVAFSMSVHTSKGCSTIELVLKPFRVALAPVVVNGATGIKLNL